MTDETTSSAAASAAQPTAWGSGRREFVLDGHSTRRTALEHAIRIHPNGPATSVVGAAAVFERYVREGAPPPPVNPDMLVRPFVDEYEMRDPDYSPSERERVILEDAIHGFIAEHWPKAGDAVKPYVPEFLTRVEGMFARLPLERMMVLHQVALERKRQEGKGYDAAHDDAHADGRIAFEAAAAILPTGAELMHPLERADAWAEPWIAYDQLDRARLIQGIALAVAEVERIDRARAAELAEAARRAEEAEEHRTHGEDSAVNDPPLSGPRANLVLVDHLEPEEAAPIAVAVPAILHADELAPSDWDDMHHALGRPRDPTKETHRNYFATNASSPEAARFRELVGYWDVRDAPASGAGHVVGHVTDLGRQALADVMRDNPELFPDVRIENATGRPGTVA